MTVLRDATLTGVYEESVGAGADQVGVGALESHGAGVTAQHSVHQRGQSAQGGQDGRHTGADNFIQNENCQYKICNNKIPE